MTKTEKTGIVGVRKEKNKNHWILPYAYAGRRSTVDIWIYEDRTGCSLNGKYIVIKGAYSEFKDSFEDALEVAIRLTEGAWIKD